MIEEQEGRIVYRESLSAWIRAFALFLGLGCGTMIPYPFIIHARWTEATWTNVLAAGCIAFAVVVGLLFVAIALAGTQELVFDRSRRTLFRTLSGPLGTWKSTIPFTRLARIETASRDTEDGPEPYLRIHVTNRKHPLQLSGLGDRAATDAWRDRLVRLTGYSAASRTPLP